MMTINNYVLAQSLEEAYELNQNKRNRVIGGMMWLKMSDFSVATAIDLSALGLDTIEETEDSFRIGAMVSLRQLETHQGLNLYADNAVADAVKDIVGVQFRNMATIGGSIFGRFGFSDVLTVFLAMDAYVELYKGGIVPLEEFAQAKGERDILVRIIVKKKPGQFIYKAIRNARTDFPVITCAVSQIADEYRAVIGARPAKAIVIRDKQELFSEGITEMSAQTFADYVAENVTTGTNMRGSAAYRTHLIRGLINRALLEMGGINHGN